MFTFTIIIMMGTDFYRCWRVSSAEGMSDRNSLQSIMLGGREETGCDCALLGLELSAVTTGQQIEQKDTQWTVLW
jgi:hypothetical protein